MFKYKNDQLPKKDWGWLNWLVDWVLTDVYQLDMIIYVWDRPLTSPSTGGGAQISLFILLTY